MITPKNPETHWLEQFINPSQLKMPGYKLIRSPAIHVKLDQNEHPYPWDPELKKIVLQKINELDWNRYYEPYPSKLEEMLCNYYGIAQGSVVFCPGSNYHITVMINMMGSFIKGNLVILRPSFFLYEDYAKYLDLKYLPWAMKNHQFDLPALEPLMKPGSLVFLSSPNNPNGAYLEPKQLAELLETYADSFFILDEAYFEFVEQDYSYLLESHSNLVLLRTFSKALGGPSARLGYTMGSPNFLHELRKRTLPYSINPFSALIGETLLQSKTLQHKLGKQIHEIKSERDRVVGDLRNLGLNIFASAGNFYLVTFSSQTECQRVFKGLVDHGIMVRNMSHFPMLEASFRVSVGLPQENSYFVEVMNKLMGSEGTQMRNQPILSAIH